MGLMSSFVRIVSTWRLPLLLLVTPMAIVWARSPSSGGALMVIAHALLVLFYALSLDGAFLREGLDPRLGLSRDRFAIDPQRLSGARSLVAFALVLVTLGLLFVSLRVGVLAGAVGVLIALTTGSARSGGGSRRFFLAELVWAVVALVGPALFIGLAGWSVPAGEPGATERVMPEADVAGTIVAAFMLGGYILLCLIRDERVDRIDGLRTTATVFTRGGAAGLLAIWALGAAALSAWGSAEGSWSWPVPAVCAWTALLTFWAVGAGRDELATRLWWLGSAATGVVLCVSLLGSPLAERRPAPLDEDAVPSAARVPATDTTYEVN